LVKPLATGFIGIGLVLNSTSYFDKAENLELIVHIKID
jgi:hypothetical protein